LVDLLDSNDVSNDAKALFVNGKERE
jgi:hypothetical protein